jgi:hypothetical protein
MLQAGGFGGSAATSRRGAGEALAWFLLTPRASTLFRTEPAGHRSSPLLERGRVLILVWVSSWTSPQASRARFAGGSLSWNDPARFGFLATAAAGFATQAGLMRTMREDAQARPAAADPRETSEWG